QPGAPVLAKAFADEAQVFAERVGPRIGDAVVVGARRLRRGASAPQSLGLTEHRVVVALGGGPDPPPLAQPGGVDPTRGGDARLHESALSPVGLAREVEG